jgi:hypothetical protein
MNNNPNRTARHHAALGFTLIELLVIIALIWCIVAGVKIGHDKIGGKIGGLIGGFLASLAFFIVLFALGALVDQIFSGAPRLPNCRNGSCCGTYFFGYSEDYETQKMGQGYVYVCRCGGRYKRRGKRFVEVNENGAEIPYLIWRPFRGWFPDNPSPKS